MTARPVHWHEGMFLRPHHLQAAQRHSAHLDQLHGKWDHHYNWGLRSVAINPDALANNRLEIQSLRARLRDGTLVSIPEDGTIPPMDLKAAMGSDRRVTVFLGVPEIRLGRSNLAGDDRAHGGRYVLDTLEIEDENTGLNPQPVQIRLLNLRLLTSNQDHAGYEVLPIASIERSGEAQTAPQIEMAYIPPILACDAWEPLRTNILQTIYNRIGTKIELLAGQVVSQGIAVESQAAGDALIIGQLRALNEAYALLGILGFANGIHPLTSYLELCRLVGQLSIYNDTHRPPDLPAYDHDDLGGCFYRVKQYIDFLLDKIIEPDYKQRPFEGAGLRMQVPLQLEWLSPAYLMFVGVKSPLPVAEVVRLLTVRGQLDMKIASSDRVDRIYQYGEAGLQFSHTPQPPRALPKMEGLSYYQINRDSQPAEWDFVRKSLTLAIRLNELKIVGTIEGQRRLTIRLGAQASQTTTLEFTLYVVRPN